MSDTPAMENQWFGKTVRAALYSRAAVWAVCLAALAAVGAGVWTLTAPIDPKDVAHSAATATLLDIGTSVRADIARVVRPAMERTAKLAADTAVVRALRSGDAANETAACNAALRASTEIDAIALFDRNGHIVAINTVYASGAPIPQERVDRIMRMSFDGRDIIQKCVRNESDDRVLEFQTTCDITPAFFDSTGLSIAYSVPVHDPETGEKLGVASARLRFDRVTDLVRARAANDQNCSIEFVTDRGAYFSEEINSGRATPPISSQALADVVAPLVADGIDYSLTRHGRDYVSLFRLHDFVTLDGGGIQVLLVVSESWLTREIRRERLLWAGADIGGGAILLLLAALLRGMSALRLSESLAVRQRGLAETALSELSAHKAALDQHALVSVLDATSAFISANDAFCRIGRFDSASLIGKPFRSVGSGAEPEEFWEHMLQTITAGETWHGEICQRSGDGELYWVQTTIVPFKDSKGTVVKYVTIGSDVTERKRVEAVRARADRAEAANQAKSEFLANMSHEIRTPLNGVIGMLDLMLGTDLSADQRRYGKLAKSSASLLTSVLGDILDLTKIEAGKLEMCPSEFNLHEAVEEVMEMMGQAAVKKGLEVACYVHPDVPLIVRADTERLRQIIVNLVNNAVKFTERGGVVLRVTPDSCTGDRAVVRFTVTDTGIGIAPDRMTRLFKAFSQADASTTRVYGGTGLGLVISKQIAELMGGSMGVESEPGRGSTFWFTAAFQLPAAQSECGPRPRFDPKALRILAVDDNNMQREVLREQISAWGIEITTAADGQEALSKLGGAAAAGTPFNVAIIDREMPEIDGFDVAMAARSRRELRGTVLLLLLSAGDEIDSQSLRAMGFSGHMNKPIRQSRLFDTIMGAIATADQGSSPRAVALVPCVPASLTEGPPQRTGLHVLVAEDNEVNQIVVREILTKCGHHCKLVPDGRQAVEAAEFGRFDLALMDCQMPVMDGFEATRMIRRAEANDARRKRLPIVALTANAMKGDRERCLEAGMDNYASKPINPEVLLETIHRVLDTAHVAPKAA